MATRNKQQSTPAATRKAGDGQAQRSPSTASAAARGSAKDADRQSTRESGNKNGGSAGGNRQAR